MSHQLIFTEIDREGCEWGVYATGVGDAHPDRKLNVVRHQHGDQPSALPGVVAFYARNMAEVEKRLGALPVTRQVDDALGIFALQIEQGWRYDAETKRRVREAVQTYIDEASPASKWHFYNIVTGRQPDTREEN